MSIFLVDTNINIIAVTDKFKPKPSSNYISIYNTTSSMPLNNVEVLSFMHITFELII